MSFVAAYAVITVLSLSIYLFTTKYLSLKDFRDVFVYVKSTVPKKLKRSLDSSISIYTELNSEPTNTDLTLKKSLRHLEFISELESYVDYSECLLSIDCLQELEGSKLKARISVLRSASILNAHADKRAA